jgi:UDP-N-acetylmuramoylalanine--D-glutamate ligase
MPLNVKGKHAVVLGFARSGIAAARLLEELGALVTINDIKPENLFVDQLKQLTPTIKTVFGSHPSELFSDAEMIVLSPGIPLDIPVLQAARSRGVTIIGELELAFAAVKSCLPEGRQMPKFLAVTGTNGKSTTTTLLYEMMRAGGFRAVLCGNIGTAASEVVLNSGVIDPLSDNAGVDFFIVEVSSFQLETIDTFHPACAAILNLTPDHLDRYHGMKAYMDAKSRIFKNQNGTDFLVLNADDAHLIELAASLKNVSPAPNVLSFSRKQRVRGAFIDKKKIIIDFDEIHAVLDPEDFIIKGVHNIENAMAASLMALSTGCCYHAIDKTLRTFPGLEHRLEQVRTVKGVHYINDSKGTNVDAVLKSLEGFTQPVILLAGGRDKDSDFRLLRDAVRDHVKAMVLVGEAAEKIAAAIEDIVPCFREPDFRSAVYRCHSLALPGDIVLLSPACASFDMFCDFEDRGRQFKELVQQL